MAGRIDPLPRLGELSAARWFRRLLTPLILVPVAAPAHVAGADPQGNLASVLGGFVFVAAVVIVVIGLRRSGRGRGRDNAGADAIAGGDDGVDGGGDGGGGGGD